MQDNQPEPLKGGEKYHEKNNNHPFDFINMRCIVCLQQNRKR